ncbi:MAG: DNA recombination protein RmuC [Myxococcota bacterium]|nr:DNA recombination protein RmuC [Myxococcota bacterium]
METLYVIAALLIGVGLGTVIGRLWQASRTSGGGNEQAAQLAVLSERAGRVEGLESALTESRAAEQESAKAVVQLEAQLAAQRQTAEQTAEAEQAAAEKQRQDHERMVAQFKAAAHEIVEERTKEFDAKSKKSIGELLKPFEKQLGDFQKHMAEAEKHASKERITLQQQVKMLNETNTQMSEEARNLTRALKGDNKSQGNWGEVVLGRVLELSGLEEGREYETEVSETAEDGSRKRPDVVIHMPGNRQVVVDAKVSLKHYEQYCEADDAAAQSEAMKLHVASIRGHVKGLSAKNYHDLNSITTIDYVLMFIPIEASFTEAVRHDRSLYDDAINKNVLIVTPSTLLAVLRTIETMWRNERQTKNAVEIAKQAGALYDKFVGFSETLSQVGSRIGQAQVAYDKAFSQLTTGRGNLVNRVKNLEALGAKTTKQFSQSISDAADDAAALDGASPMLELAAAPDGDSNG